MRTVEQLENEIDRLKNLIADRREWVEIDTQKLARLEIELKQLTETKRFYFGDKFTTETGEVFLLCEALGNPVLINLSTCRDTSGTTFDFPILWDDDKHKHYVTLLPTLYVDDFGLHIKNTGKEINDNQ